MTNEERTITDTERLDKLEQIGNFSFVRMPDFSEFTPEYKFKGGSYHLSCVWNGKATGAGGSTIREAIDNLKG